MNSSEDKLVQQEFDGLLDDYLHSKHRRKVDVITKAFRFACQAHEGARRISGEPYVMHPLAVARIVCGEMGLGSTSICCALLHDVIEDTDYTVEDIERLFDAKIAGIVDGLTKISGGIFGEHASVQAENFRKLLLTMNQDIRVILIKMADRLHNMRTLGSMLPAKQFKIAGETLYIYAPLAHRLGLFAIKTELEDLSFKYEHPEEYAFVDRKLFDTAERRNRLFENFRLPIDAKLREMGLIYDIKARVKSVFSICSKMGNKGISFDDIYDIYAVRIIFDHEEDADEKSICWSIYSAVTDVYRVRTERIRDWVSRPKANGYQALHLTVMGENGEWVEVQIRSRRMDDIAERGYAAHWKYKENSTVPLNNTELDKWIQTVTEILENPTPNALDFLDNIKLSLYATEIFVFTPKGELKTLPQGATALDFAYSLHTDIGNSCIGAKVNHRLVPLSHPLDSGDQVEVLTSGSYSPQVEWLGYVTTSKARTCIEAVLKKMRREAIRAGEEKILDALRNSGAEPSRRNLEDLAIYYGFRRQEDFYRAVEKNDVVLPDNLKKFLKEQTGTGFFKSVKNTFRALNRKSKKVHEEDPVLAEQIDIGTARIDRSKPYFLTEKGLVRNYTIAHCCKPIPGDNVFGFLGEGNQIVVHKRTCPIGMRLQSSFGERILDARWSSHETVFDATLALKGIDAIGILNDVTRVISEFNVSISYLSMEAHDGVFEGKIRMQVRDAEDIQQICLSLSKLHFVQAVSRVAE
ncbi:MAG: RelA/SpoT family protein [Tannerellaceae bacterium]|jgi:GTP pyrophosphokinase|nr:RelA/SpoT family protein [Tannerellaceae bacterium]